MPPAAPLVWRPSTSRCVVLDGFVPVPRGVVAAAPLPLVWPAKDPGDVLDYELDISAALVGNPNDSIASIQVVVVPANPGDLTLGNVAADGMVAVMWFSAGQAGITYTVQVTIITVLGRTIGRAILLPVQALVTAVAPPTSLTALTGSVITDQNGNPILIGA